MKITTPKPVLLEDYLPPSHLVSTIDLCFDLEDEATRVTSVMSLKHNPAAGNLPLPLVLNGEQLELLSVKIDGRELSTKEYHVAEQLLTIDKVPEAFTLEIQTRINPKGNTALDGLYKSGDIFCTQNEPEGFRRITYFLDRSDVMAKYTTKIIADKALYPVLLSNGNPTGHGDLPNGKHWVQWQDPFPKPCYLFALVAGDLDSITDSFTTMSGRSIDLRIYCDKGNQSRCQHAMKSLKKAMKWDEEVFGLEYDLDIFMIVAVESFNMGAMENKGLNIFNTNCVLADIRSATDTNYARIESVIGHEYFHNWTGNRVTCRDWFQLTLKEGLTVFRDQEFSADMNSRSVERIEDILALRSRQFDEDSGPMAHPIKPEQYIEINNFYTATVYNKGAEVIRMIHTLLGEEAFRLGIDKYFELYDGQAVTTEDFLNAMQLASGRDLTQFARWYHQAGTPEVELTFNYDKDKKSFAITVEQTCTETADSSPKEPFHFPLRLGLLAKDGKDMPLGRSDILEITLPKQTFVFENIPQVPIVSINRGFTAPVKIKAPHSTEDLMFLMAHDSDEVNRWEASQELGCRLLLQTLTEMDEGEDPFLDPGYIEAYGILLDDQHVDKALKALALTLPSEDTIGQRQDIIDFDGIHLIREYAYQQLALNNSEKLWEIYNHLSATEAYNYNKDAVARRALKNTCLALLVHTGEADATAQCIKQYYNANNMTDRFAALELLANIDCPERKEVLKHFYDEWKDDKLVITKWLAVQATCKLDGVLEAIQQIEKDPVFDVTVPNLVRALYEAFTSNNVHFNVNNGEGYAFIADKILELDKINPQVAARLANSYKRYGRLDKLRKKAMKRELERIMAAPDLSQGVYEIVSKILQD